MAAIWTSFVVCLAVAALSVVAVRAFPVDECVINARQQQQERSAALAAAGEGGALRPSFASAQDDLLMQPSLFLLPAASHSVALSDPHSKDPAGSMPDQPSSVIQLQRTPGGQQGGLHDGGDGGEPGVELLRV